MKEILEMIEAVDPSDGDKLGEIDTHVEYFLNPQKGYTFKDSVKRYTNDYAFQVVRHKYTRSRDALKAIRPEGWALAIYIASNHTNSGVCMRYNYRSDVPPVFSNKDKLEATTDLPTEELAELHAIIQAIEWERTK